MRVVVDTNVFVSAVFFGGVPGRILEAWRDGSVSLVVSPTILDEYRRVGRELATDHKDIDLGPLLGLLAAEALMVEPPDLAAPVCTDPADKFLACALAGRARLVVSGDKALRAVSGWRGIDVLSPRVFVDRYLR